MTAATLISLAQPTGTGHIVTGSEGISDHQSLDGSTTVAGQLVAKLTTTAAPQSVTFAEQRDEADIVNIPASVSAPLSTRAVIAAGREFTRLSAALAFFRSRSSTNAFDRQIGRLRV